MSKHTPGPWDIERGEDDAFSHTTGHYTIPRHDLTIIMDDENAAAPELLEALKAVAETFSHISNEAIARAAGSGGIIPALGKLSPHDAAEIRAAIAKAEGET